jgi:hypothetical protein
VCQSIILGVASAQAQFFRRNSSRHRRLANDIDAIGAFGIRFAK